MWRKLIIEGKAKLGGTRIEYSKIKIYLILKQYRHGNEENPRIRNSIERKQ
jgi:hypothetical protein